MPEWQSTIGALPWNCSSAAQARSDDATDREHEISGLARLRGCETLISLEVRSIERVEL